MEKHGCKSQIWLPAITVPTADASRDKQGLQSPKQLELMAPQCTTVALTGCTKRHSIQSAACMHTTTIGVAYSVPNELT